MCQDQFLRTFLDHLVCEQWVLCFQGRDDCEMEGLLSIFKDHENALIFPSKLLEALLEH